MILCYTKNMTNNLQKQMFALIGVILLGFGFIYYRTYQDKTVVPDSLPQATTTVATSTI